MRHLTRSANAALSNGDRYQGIQRMGVACLALPEARLRHDAHVWRDRAAAMVRELLKCGWQIDMPRSGG